MTSIFERDPKKRRVKPVGSAQSLLDFDLGESSDDSDFRIEDHCEESDDDSVDSNDIGKEEEDVSEQSDDSLEDPLLKKKENPNLTVGDVIEQARQQALKGGSLEDKLNKMLICCGCLGDRSDDVNEIVECDGCGVSVHEGCYGVSDVESFSSTDSLCQSAPWFCEACSAGIEDPSCELCPNKGGIFKETDVGKWVHLVCALYVPGVAFGEVDRLSSVTLFEMAYSKWGAKQCSLCEDARFARTGVCIECDAGMCHTYFHVTCAQREGLLSEAHSEEVDQADPFYAHCKLHSDKTLVRRRRRNWLALQLRAQYRQQLLKQPNHLDTEEQRRIQRKLAKHRHKYLAHKASRPPPWVPTQKMPRLLTTSASACRQLARKAELMGVDTAALEAQEAQLVALVDVRKKWHIPPAFSVEFIGYYLDRNLRVTSMKRRLQELLDINSQLLNEQQRLDRRYDEVMKDNEEQIRINVTIKEKIEMYHQVLQSSGYVKPLPQITDLTKPRIAPTLGTGLGVPTAAALKMGVGFPLPVGKGTEGVREGRVLSSQAQDQNHKGELTLRHQCGICRRSTNQHLLAKCDTCHLHYHLSCLSPPLSRMPKKTKLMGWQCSECDKESSGSEVERVDTSAPRKLRHCKDDLNLTSTPTPLQEVQLSTTPTTPSTSKNSSANLNSITNATTPDTPTTPKVTIKPVGPQPASSTPIQSSEPIYNQQPINNMTITREGSPEYMVASADGTESVSQRSAKKRRREKHKRYTPDPITGIKQRKRKHKRKSLDVENPEGQSQPEIHRRITIKIKPIPRPEGDVASESSPQMFVATSTSTEITSPPPLPKLPPPPPVPPLPSNTVPVTANVSTNNTNSRTSTGNGKRGKDTDLLTHCNVCDMSGTSQNLVMCDECKKCYHFTCLDPPVKKSPKRRGYSWHCADCDPSVRGVVKAEIIDAAGNMYIICRTIESTKGNMSVKFNTLDNALSRIPKGQSKAISISNKCANVNTELTLVMGVSKPILDYVIFCHQEDLNWPFQDGKKLKEKFDEIFDSARFNKALENIMKYIKDMNQKMHILKEQKQNCQLIVNEVVDKEAKLEDNKKRLEDSKAKIEEFDKELEPVQHKIKKFEKLDADYKNLQNEEKRKKAEYDMFKQQLDRLEKDLQYMFEGTKEELLKQIESHDEELIGQTDKIEELEKRLKNIAGKESSILSDLSNERVSNGSLRQQIKDQERKVNLRNAILNEILSSWNLDNIDTNVSELEIMALTSRLTEKMGELRHCVEQKRLKREEEENALHRAINALRSKHSKVESEKNLKESEVTQAKEEINKIKLDIVQIGAAASKLSSIELRIQEVQKKVQKLNEAMDVNVVKKEVVNKIKIRDEMETLLNTVDEEIALLLKQSMQQAELDLNKSTLHSKEKEIEELKNKRKKEIMTLFDIKELSQTKLKTNLDVVQKQLVNEMESINQEIQAEERRITTLETTISHIEHELQNKKREVNSDKEKVSSVCHYKSFDEALLLQSKKVKDLQDKRGMYAHQSVAYKEYMKQLRETNPSCPLCHRDFDERENVVTLLKEMESEMENHPNRLSECERELKIQQEKYDKMLQLKPVVEKIIQLEESELEKLMNSLEKSNNKLSISRTTVMELETKKSCPKKKLAICKDIVGDIMLWDTYIDDIFKLKQTIDNLQIRMTAAGIKTKRSLEEAQSQREELKMSLKNIRDNIEELQSKINMHNEQLNNARQEQNTLQEEQLRIQSDIQKVKELKEKQETLYSKEISLWKSINTLKKQVTIAETELNSELEKLEEKRKDNSVKLECDRKLVTDAVRRLSELQRIQDEVDISVYSNVPESLESSEKKIKDYEKLLNELLCEKSDIETTINKLRENVTRQEIRKRELSDNLALLQTQETTTNLQQQYLRIKEKLNAINYSQVLNDWKNVQSREQTILRQQNIIKGNQEELERTLHQYTQELKKDIYRQARKNYKSKCIELTVIEEAILNLKAYSKALDVAMIQYHEERMATVNRIIKQMWKLIYTGKDTTSIEIHTDATEGIGSTRRTYNYKLVQMKHGHEIDMKGRCSAGQKVLASIIIRLALAETFCKDCGILALDEPTTNLDQENADSLAEALATVVKLRSQHQKNFQLIVISHDEKFLFKLAELNSNKGFYQLYRKQSGYTAIRHCLVNSQDRIASDPIKQESDEEESSNDESEERFILQDKLHETTSQRKAPNEQTHKKRRYISDDDTDSPIESTTSKKRYIFQ